MKNIELKPVYGYGWEQRGASIDTPKPFSVQIQNYELTDDKKHYSKILGRVTGTSHRYSGKWVLLHIRTLEATPHYNVRIYENSPGASTKLGDDSSTVSPVATGFAELRRVID